MSLNKVYLIGNLGTRPELKTAKNGKLYCRLNLATNERVIRKNGEAFDKTTWHSVHVFGRQAEWVCSELDKGTRIFVEARIEQKQESDSEGRLKSAQFIRAYQVTSFNVPQAAKA